MYPSVEAALNELFWGLTGERFVVEAYDYILANGTKEEIACMEKMLAVM